MPKNNKPELVQGMVFNRLTVISFSHCDKRWRKFYNVECECGNKKIIMGSAMSSGNTKSCGCFSFESKRERQLLPDNGGAINHLILTYKSHAKQRGIVYELEREDFTRLIKMPCDYCGISNSNLKRRKNELDNFYYNGIDRVDSNYGYTKDNCVTCCEKCNKAKMSMPRIEFIDWIKRAYNHLMKYDFTLNGSDKIMNEIHEI